MASDKSPTTADFSVSGPVNGVGEPDLSGAYMVITVTPKGADPIRYRVSLGGAEVFAAEMMGALHGVQTRS